MNRHRLIATLAATVAISTTGAAWAITPGPTTTQHAGSDVPPACQEDQPCWDCQTMGNRICGPVQVLEGCHYSADDDDWRYPDHRPCRGTGEDPTSDLFGHPQCANHHQPLARQQYGTTIYLCQL
jgi:hypothetical protein